jgi:hypothetical protein
MMRALSIACLAAFLAACNTLPREVKVPVTVYCKVEKPAEPAWATKSLKPDADIFDQVKALLAERKQRIGYERLLEAAVDGCQPPAGR